MNSCNKFTLNKRFNNKKGKDYIEIYTKKIINYLEKHKREAYKKQVLNKKIYNNSSSLLQF